MANKFKTAVIGCGRIGSLFDLDEKNKIIRSHAGGYANHEKTILSAVCDLDLSKAKACKEQWNAKSFYNDYKKMLNNEKIDLLSICTHTDSHEEIISYAINYPIKAIFCEKPIAQNLRSALKILDACKANNVVLAINHQRRWDQFFIDLKTKLLQSKFGDLQHINFYYTRGVANSGSHLFDLLIYLFGEIKSVKAISSINEIKGDPTISSIIEFENSLLCNLVGLDGRNYNVFNLEIFGSKSKITIDGSKQSKLFVSKPSMRSSEFNELHEIYENQEVRTNNKIIINSISNILESIENKSEIRCSGLDGVKSLELIVATIISNNQKKRVELPLDKKYFSITI